MDVLKEELVNSDQLCSHCHDSNMRLLPNAKKLLQNVIIYLVLTTYVDTYFPRSLIVYIKIL